jgi:hypothetical protein
VIAYRATLDVTRRTGLVPAKLLLAEQTVGITEQVRPTPTCDVVLFGYDLRPRRHVASRREGLGRLRRPGLGHFTATAACLTASFGAASRASCAPRRVSLSARIARFRSPAPRPSAQRGATLRPGLRPEGVAPFGGSMADVLI